MKKMISVAFVAALLTTGVGVKANAAVADGNRELDTTAKFNVENGKLTLLEAPSLDFGSTSVESLVKGNNLLDGNASNNIKVDNYDTSVNNWTLTANAGDFVNSKDASNILTNTDIKIGDTSISGTNGVILTGTKLGQTDVAASKAQLNLGGINIRDVKSAEYTANIHWTLSDTPAATSASSFK